MANSQFYIQKENRSNDRTKTEKKTKNIVKGNSYNIYMNIFFCFVRRYLFGDISSIEIDGLRCDRKSATIFFSKYRCNSFDWKKILAKKT